MIHILKICPGTWLLDLSNKYEETIENTTPEKCCEVCFNKPDCIEWGFAPNINQCLMSTNKDTCNNNIMIPINNITW
ncbi:11862_t:CDS:2 [Rhizophagus irregularis]|nr:11862_t:CDS:2 [Rhizophagus irregularis]